MKRPGNPVFFVYFYKTMLKGFRLEEELIKYRSSKKAPEDVLLEEVTRILTRSLYSEKNILDHLKAYNKSHELLDEEGIDKTYIFTTEDIKKQCVTFRLKWLDSHHYHFDIPYEAILKIKYLNEIQKKDLAHFKIIGPSEGFRKKNKGQAFALFCKTEFGHYYLIHAWGNQLEWHRKISSFPLRNFETLAISIMIWTLFVTLSLPTFLITLDKTSTYWCGYRIATYFHLLIFFSGVSAYIFVGFNKKFSGSQWNNEKEFD